MKTSKSETITELAKALAATQGKIKSASKDAQTGHGRPYATLDSVWDACRPYLGENGLSVVQIPSTGEAGLQLETILLHTSGEWVSGVLTLPTEAKGDMNAMQAMGSAITYARRYMLAAMVGVAPGDDDDGQATGQAEYWPNPAANGSAGQATKALMDDFLARTRIELDLSEEHAKSILKELGYTGFSPDKADMYFEALKAQLEVATTTETAMLVIANAATDGYYDNIFHVRKAMEKIDPGFKYPPKVDQVDQWEVCFGLVIDYANAPKEEKGAEPK